MSLWHWLAHRWSKWEPYTIKRREPVQFLEPSPRDALFTTITMTAKMLSRTVYREKRRCETCGATQDREIYP